MLCFRSLRRCAPGPQTMLEASHMPEASIHGSLLARPGVSLRENERFPPQHCMGSGGSRLHFGAYAAAHHQESFRKHNENVYVGQEPGRNAYFLPIPDFHFLASCRFCSCRFSKKCVFSQQMRVFADVNIVRGPGAHKCLKFCPTVRRRTGTIFFLEPRIIHLRSALNPPP